MGDVANQPGGPTIRQLLDAPTTLRLPVGRHGTQGQHEGTGRGRGGNHRPLTPTSPLRSTVFTPGVEYQQQMSKRTWASFRAYARRVCTLCAWLWMQLLSLFAVSTSMSVALPAPATASATSEPHIGVGAHQSSSQLRVAAGSDNAVTLPPGTQLSVAPSAAPGPQEDLAAPRLRPITVRRHVAVELDTWVWRDVGWRALRGRSKELFTTGITCASRLRVCPAFSVCPHKAPLTPPTLTVDRVWVISADWRVFQSPVVPAPCGSVLSREGPEWGPGDPVQVVVRVQCADTNQGYLLRAADTQVAVEVVFDSKWELTRTLASLLGWLVLQVGLLQPIRDVHSWTVRVGGRCWQAGRRRITAWWRGQP